MKAAFSLFLIILMFAISNIQAETHSHVKPTDQFVDSASYSLNVPDSVNNETSNMKVIFFMGGNYGIPSSSDIEMPFEGFNIGGGIGWSFGGNIGYRNVIQIEYRKAYSRSCFIKSDGYLITGASRVVLADVALNYNYSEKLVKFNPLFSFGNKVSDSIVKRRIYLVFGLGEIEYLDTVEDGFTGNCIIYGIEWNGIEVSLGNSFSSVASIGFKIHDISFDQASFMGIDVPVDLDGLYYSIEGSVGIGFGI